MLGPIGRLLVKVLPLWNLLEAFRWIFGCSYTPCVGKSIWMWASYQLMLAKENNSEEAGLWKRLFFFFVQGFEDFWLTWLHPKVVNAGQNCRGKRWEEGRKRDCNNDCNELCFGTSLEHPCLRCAVEFGVWVIAKQCACHYLRKISEKVLSW